MKVFYLVTLLSILLMTSCSKDTDLNTSAAEGKTTLIFDAVVGNEDFALAKDFSIKAKAWNFSQLRYWISNVVLINENGEEFAVPNSHYLMEENMAAETNSTYIYPANKREKVELSGIPAGNYQAIKFSVGVPERYNGNLSLQAGELSQLNGMTNVSWMWATSYIFSSLKGKLTENGTSKTIKIETGLNANYQTVRLVLPSLLRISSSKTSAVVLHTDVAKVADGLDISANPTIGAAQPSLMTTVAANYANKVFTVNTVK